MAFDVSSLVAYVEENKADLIMKPITGSKIFDIIDIRQGIKSGEKIPIIESTAPAQAGASCGFTSSGTTTISQTTLSTTYIKIQEALCLQDLEAYYTQKYLSAGSNNETTSIEADIINRKLANIARKVGQMVMQGKTTYTNDTYLQRMNGFISQIDTAGNAVAATSSTFNTTNARTIVEEIIFQKLPLAISETGDEVVLLGTDNYRILLQKLLIDNMYHIAPSTDAWRGNEFVYPGTNVRVIGLNEMNASNTTDSGGSLPTAVKNRILAGSAKNFVAGFDVKQDMSDFKVWYSEDNQQLRFSCRFNIGVVNHFTDQIVQYTNS